jgi:predicted nucleic acid-binding protein
VSFARVPTAIVVDASVAVQFLVGDPRWTAQWLEWAEEGSTLFAPGHFAIEVANALLRSVRLPAADVTTQLGRLARSGIETVDRQLSGLLESVMLAGEHKLTVYDALYLQLALDIDGELATLDGALQKAAKEEDIALIGA